jgi:hypothetical protein
VLPRGFAGFGSTHALRLPPGGFWHPTQSQHRGTPIYQSCKPRHMALEILIGSAASPAHPRGEEVLGLGEDSIWPACYPRVGPPRRPTSVSIPRGSRPALPALGPADPTARIPASLVNAIGAAAEGSSVRRPSASWWQPEGAHCLLLAPSLWCVTACGLPGVRECMPMATTGRPNRYTKATKPVNRS